MNKKATHAQTSYINNNLVKSKRSQTVFGMSFNMIFSILLIAVFIAVAFYAITYFLNMKKCTETGMFLSDLQDNVNIIWKAGSKSMQISLALPIEIKYVCFADFEKSMDGNEEIKRELGRYEGTGKTLFLYPGKNSCKLSPYNLQHINVTEITKTKNPYCIENRGKISLTLSNNYETLVSIT